MMTKTGLSRSTLYAYIAAGAFPTQRRLGKRRVAWFASEVRNWITSRPAAGMGTAADRTAEINGAPAQLPLCALRVSARRELPKRRCDKECRVKTSSKINRTWRSILCQAGPCLHALPATYCGRSEVGPASASLPHCAGTDPRLEAPSRGLRYALKPHRVLDERTQCVALGVERLRRRVQRTVMNFRVGLRWHRHAKSSLHDALVDDRSPKYADLAFQRHQNSYITSWVRTWVDL